MPNLRWEEIFNEVNEKHKAKRDLAIKADSLSINKDNGNVMGDNWNGEKISKPLNEWALGQLFKKAGMPGRYFKDLYSKKQYDIVANNIDYNFDGKDKKLLLRLKEGASREYVRAVLTDKYSIFDDKEVIEIAGKALMDSEFEHEIIKYENNDQITAIRVTFPETETDVAPENAKQGDILKAGIVIMNSEVGASGVRLMPIVHRLVCSNGMTAWETTGKDKDFYRRHRGLDKEEMYKFAASAIKKAVAQATNTIDKMNKLQKIEIDDVEDEIKRLAKNNYLTKTIANKAIERHREEWGGDKTVYSIVNSFTNVASEMDEQDRIEVEMAAGKITNRFAAA